MSTSVINSIPLITDRFGVTSSHVIEVYQQVNHSIAMMNLNLIIIIIVSTIISIVIGFIIFWLDNNNDFGSAFIGAILMGMVAFVISGIACAIYGYFYMSTVNPEYTMWYNYICSVYGYTNTIFI